MESFLTSPAIIRFDAVVIRSGEQSPAIRRDEPAGELAMHHQHDEPDQYHRANRRCEINVLVCPEPNRDDDDSNEYSRPNPRLTVPMTNGEVVPAVRTISKRERVPPIPDRTTTNRTVVAQVRRRGFRWLVWIGHGSVRERNTEDVQHDNDSVRFAGSPRPSHSSLLGAGNPSELELM